MTHVGVGRYGLWLRACRRQILDEVEQQQVDRPMRQEHLRCIHHHQHYDIIIISSSSNSSRSIIITIDVQRRNRPICLYFTIKGRTDRQTEIRTTRN